MWLVMLFESLQSDGYLRSMTQAHSVGPPRRQLRNNDHNDDWPRLHVNQEFPSQNQIGFKPSRPSKINQQDEALACLLARASPFHHHSRGTGYAALGAPSSCITVRQGRRHSTNVPIPSLRFCHRTNHVRSVVTASSTTSSAFFKASASSGRPMAGLQSLHSSSLTTRKLHTSTFRYTPSAYIAEVSMSTPKMSRSRYFSIVVTISLKGASVVQSGPVNVTKPFLTRAFSKARTSLWAGRSPSSLDR